MLLPYRNDNIQYYDFRLGQCYVGLGEADKAIEVLQKHCVDLRKSGGGTTSHKHQVQVLYIDVDNLRKYF